MTISQYVRNLVYPGLDLHTRNRASLAQVLEVWAEDVLDAGSETATFPGLPTSPAPVW